MPCQSRPAISFARDAPDREARTVGRLPSRAKRLLGERQSSDCFQPRRERVAHPITASVRGQFAPREAVARIVQSRSWGLARSARPIASLRHGRNQRFVGALLLLGLAVSMDWIIHTAIVPLAVKIGRASCRGSVCAYVQFWEGAGSLKKK